MKKFVNLSFATGPGAEEQAVLVETTMEMAQGDVFPPDCLPDGVSTHAPMVVLSRVECAGEGVMPATADYFVRGVLGHYNGPEAMVRAFVEDGWQLYEGVVPPELTVSS